jgi:fatty-acyl-CoA synthase
MSSALNGHSLSDLLRRTARRQPDKPAIVCGAVSWTYAEFAERVARVAGGLADHAVASGDRVAILSRNSHAFAVVRFALARIGAILVPVNFMLRPEEAAYILKHSGAKLLFVDATLVELGRAAAALDTDVEALLWLPGEDTAEPPADLVTFDDLQRSTTHVEPAIDPRSVAQIIYTSGTESLPKGAMLTHESVITQYVSCIVDAGIDGDDRLLHALPMYHCAQLDCFLGPAIYVGASNVITGRPTPDNLLRLLGEQHITSFFAPPTVWISLLRCPDFDRTDLSWLRKGYYGAAIMPVEVLRELQRRLPQIRLWNLYGQTEIAPLATVLKPEDQLRKAGTAGRPCLNVETRVVDDTGHDVPVGAVGEVVHRSPQLLQGYYRDPERTSAAFAGGWFHSGDLATLDDEGYLTIVDRKKDMIKTGGENVASREVEETIYRLPQVAEVAVIGLPDPKWIEAVTAVVVLRSGVSLDAEAIVAHCRAHMAPYKVPKHVLFMDTLPKNPSGKLLKRELRSMLKPPSAAR